MSCWKVESHCKKLMVQGLLEVTFLPRATTYVYGMFDAGVMSLQESLKWHPNLEMIGLNNNKIGPEAAKSLGYVIRAEARHPVTKMLYRTNKIKGLYLTLNRLGPEGANTIVDAIIYQQRYGGPAFMTNDGLEELFLDSNVIGDIGASAIARMLHPSKATLVRRVSLRSNRITDVGAKQILNNIQTNNGILELDLALNPISPSILAPIKAKLDANCCVFLYFMIKHREEDICREAIPIKKKCIDDAKTLATTIRNHYEPDQRCCERVKMNRCI